MNATLSAPSVVDCAAGFTEPFDWSIYQKDGVTPLVLAAGDVVHFELYSAEAGTQLLSIDNGTPSAGGSSLSISTRGSLPDTPAAGQVVLDEDDTASLSGRKYFVMWFKDTADSDRKKIFRRGLINFLAR
jgi:hypothetical protein